MRRVIRGKRAHFFQAKARTKKSTRLNPRATGIKKGRSPAYGKFAGEINTLEKINKEMTKVSQERIFMLED